jgi:hypothetical protein
VPARDTERRMTDNERFTLLYNLQGVLPLGVPVT